MALEEKCDSATQVGNSGVGAGCKLDVPAGIIAVPKAAKWTAANMADFYAYIQTMIHAVKPSRWYPVFSNLVNIEIAKEGDTIITRANGSRKMTRLGGYSFTYSFADGGECLAKFLMSLNKAGYAFIYVDVQSRFKVRKNADGTYSAPRADDLFSPGADLETFDAEFMNKLIGYVTAEEWIMKSDIFKNTEDLTELIGLFDTVASSRAAATTTKVTVGFKTECDGVDLYDLPGIPDALAVAAAFSVRDNATGTAVTVTAVAKNAAVKGWDLTFSSQAGKTLIVGQSSPAAWLTLATPVPGYDVVTPVEIVIPAS